MRESKEKTMTNKIKLQNLPRPLPCSYANLVYLVLMKNMNCLLSWKNVPTVDRQYTNISLVPSKISTPSI